jgi:23S rRNA pseudouridine1911/1915/1917 synthase
MLLSAKPPTHRRRSVPSDLEILFEDRDLVVVIKPAGLLTIATDRERNRTAYALLFEHVRRQRDGRLFIVHRLDREASGLLVFAKSEDAKFALQEQFKDHSAGRTYVAVTEGRLPRETFTIESYLAENAAFRCYSTRDPAKGKRAVTHVTVLKRAPHRTLVEVRLETGRKHQIRVHLAEEGFPIVGDPAYGNGRNPIRRMALHGAGLVFRHPRTGQTMTFAAPLPAVFESLVQPGKSAREAAHIASPADLGPRSATGSPRRPDAGSGQGGDSRSATAGGASDRRCAPRR